MDHLAKALIDALLVICARGDEASGQALKGIVHDLRELSDHESAVLRTALLAAAEEFDPFDPDQMLFELLDEAIFGDEDTPYRL